MGELILFKRAIVHKAGTSFVPLEVLLDPCRTWCPSSTCQAVCQLKEADSPALPQLVQCAVCTLEFCSACKANWHPGQACQENNLPITSFLPGENRYRFLPVYLFTYVIYIFNNGYLICVCVPNILINTFIHVSFLVTPGLALDMSTWALWNCHWAFWAFLWIIIK